MQWIPLLLFVLNVALVGLVIAWIVSRVAKETVIPASTHNEENEFEKRLTRKQ
ncbi:hypothetical protein [Thalassobacillus hwangdonensis]|uniref:Uncharacterized protein n=1 Tax=Thalassobacillus hwangdonensis TaxID=546108 RepID=A0ABW3L538_9BACI